MAGSEKHWLKRKGRNDYYGDVAYEVWRRGGNPDAVDYDRLDDYRYAGLYSDEAASRELRRQFRKRELDE